MRLRRFRRGQGMKKGPVARAFFSAVRLARLVLLALFVAVRILLAGLALLVRLTLLLAGLLARLRLVLALGLLIVLTRLIVLVRHIVLQGVVVPAFREPLLATIVPQKSHSSYGFFVNIQTLAQLRGMPVSRSQHKLFLILARQFDWRGTHT